MMGLIGSLAAIRTAAYLFTNVVEILGDRLGLSQSGVGSVLAKKSERRERSS